VFYNVTDVEPRGRYRVWLRFEDGLEGEVDLAPLAGKGVFETWLEPGAFERVYVDAEAGTIAWPGGIDLAPDRLYSDVAGVESEAG